MSVYISKLPENKTSVDPKKISGKLFLRTSGWKDCFGDFVNQELN
jgi:hypothetical protein